MVEEIWAEFHRIIVELKRDYNGETICFLRKITVFWNIFKNSANESFGLLIFGRMCYSA
jgi:hypothetical protein